MYIEGCSEDVMYFSLFFLFQIHHILFIVVLWLFWHILYLYSFYIDVCFSFTYPYHVLFLFLMYTHVFFILYAIYYFCFTQRCLDEFCLKCFRNIGCQNLLTIRIDFSRVCIRIDLIVFNKWIWVEWFMTSLICSFVCCGFVTDYQRGRLLGHMCFTC